jgi:hypothetical protein
MHHMLIIIKVSLVLSFIEKFNLSYYFLEPKYEFLGKIFLDIFFFFRREILSYRKS